MTASKTPKISGSHTTPRRLILVDIENFNGCPVKSTAQAKWCKNTLTRWLDIKEGEIVIIATDQSNIFNVNAGWKGPRLLAGTGPDGADLRLVDEIDRMMLGQFDEIALVSGDGIFAGPVARAADHGIPTTVYGHGGEISKRLQLAASQVRVSQNGYDPTPITPVAEPAQTANVIQLMHPTKEVA